MAMDEHGAPESNAAAGPDPATTPPAVRPADRKPTVKSEVRELLLLFEISQILDRAVDLREVGPTVLAAMAQHAGMMRAALRVGAVDLVATYGPSPERWDDLHEQVLDRGGPLLTGRDGGVLDGDAAVHKRDVAGLCVPVRSGAELLGALCVDRLFPPSVPFEEDVRLLSVVASMIAQAVRLRQATEAERMRLLAENARLKEQLGTRLRPAAIIGRSKAIAAVFEAVSQVAGSDATVLLRGESGAGKELVAHAIHHASRRASGPFVKVNCAALPETVLESELFGHERGAFTGAVARRTGRFELAHGGTIFLDEVGDFSAAIQVALLRFLQEREFERVGGTTTLRVDVRVIAATHRDLEAMVADGRFRQDLYYRLNVFPIRVPPLRERRTDIPMLVDHFIEKYGRLKSFPTSSGRQDAPASAERIGAAATEAYQGNTPQGADAPRRPRGGMQPRGGTCGEALDGKRVRRVSTPALDMLMAYEWPGNVRELENCIERAVLLSDDEVIHGHHLPPTLQTAEATHTLPAGTLAENLARVERELIVDALKTARGNVAKAARALGVTERVMGLRVRHHGIDPRRFRTPR